MELLRKPAHPLPSLSAGLVISALGLNVWALLLLVPVLAAISSGTRSSGLPLWPLFTPLPILAWGVFRLSRVALLALYPISLALLNALARGPSGQGIFTVWTFGLAAISLFGYLVGATVVLEVQSRKDDAVSRRRLPLPPLSSKWRRRRRVYRMLAIFAALIPLAFIYTVDFHPATARHLQKEYGPGAEEMQTLVVVAALGLWLWLFHTFFMTPLEAHRRGDGDVRRELRLLEQRSRKKPRTSFYFLVLAALLLMGLLLWLRRRYG